MTTLAQVALLLTLLAEPLLALAADLRTHLRARRGAALHGPAPTPVTDLTVVVPVRGDVHELELLADLRDEGERVLLVATAAHPSAYLRRLWSTAGRHGFRVHLVGATRRFGTPTHDGSTRTGLLRAAHDVLTSGYVVVVDPGTSLGRTPAELVGELVTAGLDLATVTTEVPPHGLLARLQRVEDTLAGRLRRRAPWLARGGVHVARRAVHGDLLRRHTGFGPGDEAELSVLAAARGLRVGHLDAPAVGRGTGRARVWWWHRVLEAAGAFRLGVANLHLGVRHPSLRLGLVTASFLAVPLLWWGVLHAPWAVGAALLVHGLLTAVVTRSRPDVVAWLHPVHVLVRVLVLLPLGVLLHVAVAVRSGRSGVLRVHDAWWSEEGVAEPVVRRLPGPGPARATDWWARR